MEIITVENLYTHVASFLRQKHIMLLSSVIFTVALLLCIISSVILGIALMSSYFGGILFFHSLFSHNLPPPNMLFMLKRRKKIVSRSEVPRYCTICGDSRCRRHKADYSLYNLQPWAEIKISQEIDEALEDFLNSILQRFVYSWFREISDDEFFTHELRLCLRFMIAVLLRRSMKVDLTLLITDKLLKVAVQHVDCFMQAQRSIGNNKNVEQAVLESFSSNLHSAMYSRQQELKYIRHLSQNIMPYLLPKKYLKCKSTCALLPQILSGPILLSAMDVIAEPFVINNLLILFFDKTPMTRYPEPISPGVELLANFVENYTPTSKSTLHVSLSTILNDQSLLYPFIQFMKEEAAINILQFCLSVEDFNRQMLDPDLTNDQLNALHKEARHLYETYCSPDGIDRIQLDKNLVEEIKRIVYGPPEDVIKLRTTPPLFKLYDQAYSLLENIFCPLFYQSDNYFTLFCGSRLTERNDGTSVNHMPSPKYGGSHARSHKKELSAVAKFGNKFNKIKGVFKPATVEGKILKDDLQTDIADAVYSDDAVDEKDGVIDDIQLTKRDMSAWRISIPNIDTELEEGWKLYYIYIIDVQSIDIKINNDPEAQHWRVKRRYHEFYVLEAKLTEFHGDLEDAHLPPKRGLSSKGFDFVESRRKIFEEFLQKLLVKPHLRNSELLYAFLTPSAEFSMTMLPDINFGKMIKTMPMKLLKEKGQHLEPFLQSFFSSTEASKPKPSKLECRDIHDVPESEINQKLQNSPYKNNANVEKIHRDTGRPRHEYDATGVYDYILYLAVRVFEVPSWFLQCLMALQMAAKNTFDAFIVWYIDMKLEQALVPQRLAQLIRLLKNAILEKSAENPTKEEKQFTAEKALNSFRNAIPEILIRAIGATRFTEGSETLFSILQHPRLNKQLSYTFLDIVAIELFPELSWPERSSSSFAD